MRRAAAVPAAHATVALLAMLVGSGAGWGGCGVAALSLAPSSCLRRFKGENFVAGPPFVRFLAGVPLLSASGKVYGTL